MVTISKGLGLGLSASCALISGKIKQPVMMEG